MKAIADFIDYTILDKTSEDPDYLVSDLKNYSSSTESYRTNDALESVVQIDLGAVYLNPRICIYGSNFNSFQVKQYPDDTFTTPDWTSSSYTIEQDPEDLRYKIGQILTGFNGRYLELVIPVQARLDGAAAYEIGAMLVISSVEDFEVTGSSLGLPVDIELLNPEELIRYDTNRKDIIPLSDLPVLQYGIRGTMTNSEANRLKAAKVFGHPLKNIIYLERNNEHSWQVYLFQRVGSMSMSEQIGTEKGIKEYAFRLETIL